MGLLGVGLLLLCGLERLLRGLRAALRGGEGVLLLVQVGQGGSLLLGGIGGLGLGLSDCGVGAGGFGLGQGERVLAFADLLLGGLEALGRHGRLGLGDLAVRRVEGGLGFGDLGVGDLLGGCRLVGRGLLGGRLLLRGGEGVLGGLGGGLGLLLGFDGGVVGGLLVCGVLLRLVGRLLQAVEAGCAARLLVGLLGVGLLLLGGVERAFRRGLLGHGGSEVVACLLQIVRGLGRGGFRVGDHRLELAGRGLVCVGLGLRGLRGSGVGGVLGGLGREVRRAVDLERGLGLGGVARRLVDGVLRLVERVRRGDVLADQGRPVAGRGRELLQVALRRAVACDGAVGGQRRRGHRRQR